MTVAMNNLLRTEHLAVATRIFENVFVVAVVVTNLVVETRWSDYKFSRDESSST